MVVKVFFVGNAHAGDDAIGPYLYEELKGRPELQALCLKDSGVSELDLLEGLQDQDKVIIVDAIRSKHSIGKVSIYQEGDLSSLSSCLSAHDFGVQQVLRLLRIMHPGLNPVSIIGIHVSMDGLHPGFGQKVKASLPRIKEQVMRGILKESV